MVDSSNEPKAGSKVDLCKILFKTQDADNQDNVQSWNEKPDSANRKATKQLLTTSLNRQ
jgi:hypothetical protein